MRVARRAVLLRLCLVPALIVFPAVFFLGASGGTAVFAAGVFAAQALFNGMHSFSGNYLVLATDINPRFLDSLKRPNLEVRRHDVAVDPLPDATFDLIHARLVLVHVPEREKVLERMAGWLKPGGWILDEEFDSSVSPDPSLNDGESLSKTFVAMRQVLADRGTDRTFGRRLFGRLRDLQLVDVGAEGRTLMWPAGSEGSTLMRANFEQLHEEMVTRGYVTEREYESDLAALDAPSFLMPSPVLWAAWGRRAA